MGWTQYRESMDEQQALAECRSLCEWENDATRSTVRAHGITGSGEDRGYYAAVERTDKATGAREVYCAVFLITLAPFGYKDMCETMGPRICKAPREVLEALEPLPPRTPTPCSWCEGTGKTPANPKWRQEAWGSECFSCHGSGETDRYDSARRWRRDAWARLGGEPQGKQLALAV